MNLADMTARGLNGQPITREEALEILRSDDSELLSIVAAAGKVRRHFFDNRVRLNYLVNLKSGLCPEDCFYCSQRLSSQALSLIHISEPTRHTNASRMPSSA